MIDGGTSTEATRRAEKHPRPRHCVWELTLACNLRCEHCGSSAGRALPDELPTQRCLDVVGELADLGCEVLSLSGGEPTLRDDWDAIARAGVRRGIRVNMVTNGVYRGRVSREEVVRRAVGAGLCNVAVSIDGVAATHDAIRGRGTFAESLASVERFARAGMPVTVMTTISRKNLGELDEVRRIAARAGAASWRVQIAKPMGNLRGRDDFVIAPRDLPPLVHALARMKARGVELRIGDSIGYFGPHDQLLRGRGWDGRRESWQGCQAGLRAVGIEADGGVKGCLSLQAGRGAEDPFREGSLRDSRLSEIWFRPGAFSYNRDFSVDSLGGFCRTCEHAPVCRGGAHCMASAVTGGIADNPCCTHRVLALWGEDRRKLLRSSAAAAAVAMVAGVGALGCREGGTRRPAVRDEADAGCPEPCAVAEYGVEPQPVAPKRDAGAADAAAADAKVCPDPCYDTEYGDLPPSDAGCPEPCNVAEYGVEPEPDAGCPEPCNVDEYGVDPPPAYPDAGPDAPDCSDVCCECDYGVPPPGCCG